jgi:hypothetical protein
VDIRIKENDNQIDPQIHLGTTEATRSKAAGECCTDPALGRQTPEITRSLTVDRYWLLSGMHDHPLAIRGRVYEHVANLFARLGLGPHPCHWCGTALDWGIGRRGNAADRSPDDTVVGIKQLQTDHLDSDTENNDPLNVEPSCFPCNARRGRWIERLIREMGEDSRALVVSLSPKIFRGNMSFVEFSKRVRGEAGDQDAPEEVLRAAA